MTIGSRIKERRKELGLTQKELADKVGVQNSAIANYETGVSSPKEKVLYKLFEALDCDANYLFQDEYEKREEKDNRNYENIKKMLDTMNQEASRKVEEYTKDLMESGKYKKEKKAMLIFKERDNEIAAYGGGEIKISRKQYEELKEKSREDRKKKGWE